MSVIKVEKLTKYYDKTLAVNDISFEITKGSITGFVGKNGAGKSTTIRCLLNLINPTSGICTINDLDCVKHSKQLKKYLSYMPSDSAFYNGLSTKDLFKLCIKYSDKSFEEVESLCEYFELDMHKKVSDLSYGNRKKVSIIQALLKSSELLILDEPTNGLDPLMQEKFFKLILDKNKAGVTIFLSSHNLLEIEKYCDRVLIIKDGQIIDDIDMKNNILQRPKVVTYTTSDQVSKTYDYEGKLNDLIKELSTLDLVDLEIKNKSVEAEFIKYYQEETN